MKIQYKNRLHNEIPKEVGKKEDLNLPRGGGKKKMDTAQK